MKMRLFKITTLKIFLKRFLVSYYFILLEDRTFFFIETGSYIGI